MEQAFPYGFGVKNEEREKTARKVALVKERGGRGDERKGNAPLLLPPLFFGSRSISRLAKTENPVFFQTKTLATQAKVLQSERVLCSIYIMAV